MSRKHMGSSIDDFLKEEGIFEEAQTQAVTLTGCWMPRTAIEPSARSRHGRAPRHHPACVTNQAHYRRLYNSHAVAITAAVPMAILVSKSQTLVTSWVGTIEVRIASSVMAQPESALARLPAFQALPKM